MKKILLFSVLLCVTFTLWGRPAHNGAIRYTQPDGSVIEIYRHGDEWGRWTTNAAGKVISLDADGFYREMEGVTPKMAAQAAAIRRKAFRQQENAAYASSAPVAVGQKHFLVILVQFSDVSFKAENDREAFYNLMNQPGYSVDGHSGSARDYYYDNSHGYFEPIFDVYGPVTLSNTQAYYGANTMSGDDAHPGEAVAEGCKLLDGQIDFSQYDNDGDGEVDLVFMFYAGYGEADSPYENTIWPHRYWLQYSGDSVTLDGKKINSYSCSNELNYYGSLAHKLCSIGTPTHEFAHAMGLPDFYDIDYDDNEACTALTYFSVMDTGCDCNDGRTPPYFNIVERILLGWLDDDVIKPFVKDGPVTLPSVQNNIAYITTTDMDGEYFIYECRSNEGWDKALGAYGLLVYHYDRSSRIVEGGYSASALWNYWAINVYGNHPCFYVVPSADQSNVRYGMTYYPGYGYYFTGDLSGFPFPGSKNVTSYTAKSWNGVDSEISLSDISYASNVVTFTVSGAAADIGYNTIANPGKGSYSAGSKFDFQLVEVATRPVQSVKWYFDGALQSAGSVTLTAGSHIVEAVLSLEDGTVDTVTLEIKAQ